MSMMTVPRWVLANLVSDEDCWFDHHGNCQAHYKFEIGEAYPRCPHAEARELLADPASKP